MELNLIIAENLNRLRLEWNLSLGKLAELSGVSKVMLSQIEKGETNPTINTIWKIAKGLNVPYTLLIDKHELAPILVMKSEVNMQTSEDGTYRIFCYYPNNGKRNFEMFLIELDVGASYTCVGHSEKSEEYLTVLEGELLLEVNGDSYILKNEDSICFSSAFEHTYTNKGITLLKALIINLYAL